MIYLTNLKKQYGERVLFKDVSLHLHSGEKIGLVGHNGMGKTTLLRLILEEERPDAGKVSVSKNARIAMLAQDLEPGDETVLERVVLGDSYFAAVREEMEQLQNDGNAHDDNPDKWSSRYGHLHHEFERVGGYERDARAKTILMGLGFKPGQCDAPLTSFSGGWRMRAELARLLLQNPDVLLLDEPSNHLDLRSVIWLENFLKSYKGAVILISHDRRFLNGLVGRIVDLDNETLTAYTGNYDEYEKQKAQREIQLELASARQRRKISEIDRFVERFRAKASKAKQVQSRIKMLEKLDRIKTTAKNKTVSFRFPQPARSGRICVEFTHVSKSYGSVTVYSDLSLRLERASKVALVGENGAGKSTLLKLLAGAIEHDRGDIKLGSNVTRAYFVQHQSETLDPGLTVLESIEEIADNLLRTHQQTLLGGFRFSGDDVNKKVSVLSGGERSRLALARMLVAPASILLLDEPTNHLDMRSREVLAAALADFEGTLCTISHDRDFLDGFINRVWEVGGGGVKEYFGNYSDYEYAKSRDTELSLSAGGKEKFPTLTTQTKKNKSQKRLEAEERNLKHRQTQPLKMQLEETEKNLEQVIKEKEILDQILSGE
ncbi:MAG: ABC-F family ATP-binding cassette domain-containing protein, partial [Nitrospinota bacterium]|nr:ABC-F family ATP-binding cassette domain-containing protein [Nitrospinota bacterium]